MCQVINNIIFLITIIFPFEIKKVILDFYYVRVLFNFIFYLIILFI